MNASISCPSADVLKQLLDGALPEHQQTAVNEHLDSCPSCQNTLEGMVAGKESWSEAARHLSNEDESKEPALDRAVAALQNDAGQTLTHADSSVRAEFSLDFLSPSEKPGHLGRLDHYEIMQVVGQGGFGVVLKAFDEKLHRVVAIKVLGSELAGNATARRRFNREAKAAAAVVHEHVVTIHAVEEERKPPYLVMQFVEGMSLQDKLDKTGPLSVKEILRIGMQAASGLAAAHKQGLVHRDIKPANILLENGVERVKITDFGLARAVDDASLSQSGVVAGTPQYMAPEQAKAEAVDQRADLFSLGSVLYALCTGHAPFRASTSLAVLKRVCDDTPRPIREINPEIPDWLTAIIDKLHAKNPADRFRSATEVAELLGGRLADMQAGRVIEPRIDRQAEARNGPDGAPATDAATREFTSHGSPGTSASHWRRVAVVLVVFIAFGLAAIRFLNRNKNDFVNQPNGEKLSVIVLGGLYDPVSLEKIVLRSVEVVDERIEHNGKHVVELKQEPAFIKQKKLSEATLPPGKYEAEVVAKPGYKLARYEIAPEAPGLHTSGIGGQIRWLIELRPGDRTVIQVVMEKESNEPGALQQIQRLDKERLQGLWIAESAEIEGKPLMKDMVEELHVVFAFDGMAIAMPRGKGTEGTLVLEPNHTPKKVTVIGENSMWGIYRLEGDKLTLCMGETAEDPPEDFKTGPRARHWLAVLRRADLNAAVTMEKLERIQKKRVRDVEILGLQGVWIGESAEAQVHTLAKDMVDKGLMRIVFKGNTMEVPIIGAEKAEQRSFQLDPAKNPKHIDVTREKDQKMMRGIYKLDADRLTICMGEPEDPRPTEFKAAPGTQQMLVRFRRPTSSEDGWVPLFNGKDLTGWVPRVEKNQLPERAWEIVDGVLISRGLPNGYLRTEKTYEKFILEMECQASQPFSVEKPTWAGDLLLQIPDPDPGFAAVSGLRMQILPGGKGILIPMRVPNAAPGKDIDWRDFQNGWNRLRIVSEGGSLSLSLNGKSLIVADCPSKKGYFAIMSVATGMRYRNIRIKVPQQVKP